VIWVIAAIGMLVGASALVVAVGAMLPREHSVSRTAPLNRPPDVLWEAITDFAGQVSWREDLHHVERLPDMDGRQVWKETNKRGQALTMETVESVPPSRLVRRIADDNLPFGGSWTYEIGQYGEVAALTITENGEIYNPFFRFVSRFIIGHTATIDGYLMALSKKLGVEVSITGA
jgi:uncharacterized protein YndB with AHSA1/START domain